jgi:pyruvate/2-oxoglutarate dehydrogenase complex dihydrolipoamide acyltransferase (E2) component
MSEITLFSQGGDLAIPDYLKGVDNITRALAGSAGKSISIKGSVWRMVVGGEEVSQAESRALEVVVLGAALKTHRTYYEGAYEEGKDTPPVCWSADGVAPNEEVPEETRQSNSCATCPQNIAGSGRDNSRACRYSRRLAVALANDITGNIYRLQLPATSLFGKPEGGKMPLDAYAKFLAGHQVPITGVVTEMKFDTAAAVPTVRFRAVRPLTRPEWEAAQAAATEPEAVQAVEFKFSPRKPEVGAAPAAAPAPAPAPAPAARASRKTAAAKAAEPATSPARDVVEDAVIKEPTRRTSAPAPEPTPVTSAAMPASVADILDSWGNDDDE